MTKTVAPVTRLRGRLIAPPDKSIAHRKAMFAALADGTSVITNYSPAADPQSTLSCLRQLGVTMHQEGSTVTIQGVGRSGFKVPEAPLDCGNSGTTMRMLTGILAGANIPCTLIGDESLSNRPMKRILKPLREMGALLSAREDEFAPLQLAKHDGLKALRYTLPVASAQLKSCVLLAGLFADGLTEVIETEQSRNHTELMLHLPMEEKDGAIHVYSSRDQVIPLQTGAVSGDPSAATFLLVAASCIPGSEIVMENVGLNPSRIAAFRILERMGAAISYQLDATQREPQGTVTVRYAPLKATEILADEVANCIDELPILSVAMAFAEGTSRYRGAKELRIKECDRIDAMANVLRNTGVRFTEFEDGMEIVGQQDFAPRAATQETWHDHRIVMSAAILALKATSSSEILHHEAAGVSYPDFWNHLDLLRQD